MEPQAKSARRRRRSITKQLDAICKRSRRNDFPTEDLSLRNEFQECPYCGCRYKGKSSYTTHLRKKHADMQKDVKCFVCETKFDEELFGRHFRLHQLQDMQQSQGSYRLLRCDFCEFNCSLNVDMIQHIGTEHDGNKAFSIARTQAQFLVNARNYKRQTSDNDSERTLSGNEAAEIDYEEMLDEAAVCIERPHDHCNDNAELLACLKRGRNEVAEKGFTVAMLHHLLVTPYERSWIKLLISPGSKFVRIPIDLASLAENHERLTSFVIENDVPDSLRKLFEFDAWRHLMTMIEAKRAAFTCFVCRATQNLKVIHCQTCQRRYHHGCSVQISLQSGYHCSTCFL